MTFRHAHCKGSGFTLVELIIVIFIISLCSALVIPSLWPDEETLLRRDAQRLASSLRYVYDEALGKKESLLFTIDFHASSWGYESPSEERKFSLSKGVVFEEVASPSLGAVSRGKIAIPFDALGASEPMTVDLRGGTAGYRIVFNNMSGRVKIGGSPPQGAAAEDGQSPAW